MSSISYFKWTPLYTCYIIYESNLYYKKPTIAQLPVVVSMFLSIQSIINYGSPEYNISVY